MTRHTIAIATLALSITLQSHADNLQGFRYGNELAPTGREWESPEDLSLGKEQPHAWMFHFASPEDALRVLPETSTLWQSLDGTWKFHWAPTPQERPASFYEQAFDASLWDDIRVPGCWNVQGLQKDGSMKYGVPLYVNQPVMFQHEVKVDDWRKGVMRTPPANWTTYRDRNEVGSYRRTFTVPAAWRGKQVFINFDGVDSFFYLWINGQYVGFSKNSRNTASFDITRYLRENGENVVAVEVYRHSDGSFLEAQDMFRLPGIIRSTYLTAAPKVRIEDLAVRTTKIGADDAEIQVDLSIRDNGEKKQKAYNYSYKVYPVELYSDNVTGEAKTTAEGLCRDTASSITMPIGQARLWSAEAPHRYILVATLTDRKGRVMDCVSTFFGVRKVEILETAASDDEFGLSGRYFYVNNKPVKLKGVNRHETSLSEGHAITRKQMEREVMLMKQGNINHIRMSHYSNDPYMYYLCDRYGIYLEDECNLESHEYYYGDASLSHPEEWKAAHVARNMEMVHAHVNHPSIVIWSLGNEAGPGQNFVAAYEAIKAFDQSRPVQYERNNNIVDMGSNQYPSVAWVQGAVKGNFKIKYPFHISEYAHSMGNSLGNLVDYWEAMESTNFFCGGAIWDWVDQAVDTYTKDGVKYMGYGGDHGDWPNDGMFCMNGIMLPDLTPKPQYYEVKKVYQNVGVHLDSIFSMGQHTMVKMTIFNKNYFVPLDDYDIVGIVMCDGTAVSEFPIRLPQSIAPRQKFTLTVPMKILVQGGELFLNVEFRQKHDTPWAKAGYVQMSEQLPITVDMEEKSMPSTAGRALKVVRGGTEIDVQGAGFHVSFDETEGGIQTLVVDGNTLIEPGCGPRLNAFRAPVDNDNWAFNQWFQNGLYDLRHRVTSQPQVIREKDGSVSIVFSIMSQASHKGRIIRRPGKAGNPFERIENGAEMTADDFHFTTSVRYTVYPDASIVVASNIASSDASIALPRLGYAMKMPARFDQYTYYGRGPLNNYADRRTGSFIGLYRSTVQEQFVHFPKPQSMGNREEVRWCALTDKVGHGLQFIATSKQGSKGQVMSTSALPWSDLQLTLSAHPHELPQSDGTYLHLDCQVTGLGGNSCGQGGPLEKDRVKGELHQFKFIIRPTRIGDNLSLTGKMTDRVECPIGIVRNKTSKISIIGDTNVMDPSPILYTVTSEGKTTKPQQYDSASLINLRKGGTVTAWYEGDDAVRTKMTFEALDSNIPLDVVYASSEELPHGDVAKRLVDGNPATIWHTMYSITVATYPHWIDFDCNEVKSIKGFAYLPRQDGGTNGNIKGYKLQLSMDGKTWSDPVCEGNFENNPKEKRITFKAQKARYVRFTATSSQNGREFASGAEFRVLAED